MKQEEKYLEGKKHFLENEAILLLGVLSDAARYEILLFTEGFNMSTPPAGIHSTIADLMRRSHRLADLARELAGEYGLSADEIAASQGKELLNGHPGVMQSTAPVEAVEAVEVHVSRADQLKQYLASHGPTKSRDILAGTGIPRGTIAKLLNDRCTRLSGGRWSWRDTD